MWDEGRTRACTYRVSCKRPLHRLRSGRSVRSRGAWNLRATLALHSTPSNLRLPFIRNLSTPKVDPSSGTQLQMIPTRRHRECVPEQAAEAGSGRPFPAPRPPRPPSTASQRSLIPGIIPEPSPARLVRHILTNRNPLNIFLFACLPFLITFTLSSLAVRLGKAADRWERRSRRSIHSALKDGVATQTHFTQLFLSLTQALWKWEWIHESHENGGW